ncbi:MAG: MATE family efflux transporter [Rhodospirillales bacterium]
MALGSQRSRLLRLAWPIMISNVTVPLVGATDVFVMGHQPDAALLAGLGLGTAAFSLSLFSFNFLRMGTTGPASQAAGAGNMAEARAILYRASILAVFIGILLILIRPLIILALHVAAPAEPAVEQAAAAYLHIRLLGAPMALIEMVLVGWLWALQDSRSALYVQLATNLVNICLDLWFVLGLNWGVEGAAIASVLAHGCGALLGCLIVWRRLGLDRWIVPAGMFAWERIRGMLLVNRDIFIRTVCVVIGLLMFRLEANRFGAVAAASIEPLYQFLTVTAYALDGISHAVEPMTGDAIGRKNRNALREAAIAALQAGGIMAFVMTTALFIFGPNIISIFTTIPEVVILAKAYYHYAAILPFIAVWCYLFDGMFLGAALASVCRNAMLQTMVVYLICLFTLPRWLGLDGLWLAILIFMALRGVTLAIKWERLLGSADAKLP